ncbi:MAG TPA: GNAT family N-acetyltransferase [Terriglobales bacterium]|nr:GNAT family N-acetyltransferase [Terriglobales bacterium]
MLKIRPATIDDAPLLRQLIWELADYEKEPDEVRITAGDLARDGFGPDPQFRALIAEWDGQPAGYAVFLRFYSTWSGRRMYLEDVFVRPQFRGRGIGRTIMARVASIALEENCTAMGWEVLHWNQRAIDVYRSVGAEFLESWRLMILRGDSLRKLAERDQ